MARIINLIIVILEIIAFTKAIRKRSLGLRRIKQMVPTGSSALRITE